MDRHRNDVVVVTGAGRGIGRAIALAYAQSGASIWVVDLDQRAAEQCVEEIRRLGGKAQAYQADISVPAQVTLCIQQAAEKFGGIGILINNAGIGVGKHPDELTVEEWDRVIHTNLRGTFLCTREAVKWMRKRGRGSVVNIASTRALMSEPNTEAYAASKGGIVAITHALAASYAQDLIQINAISPGWIETGDYDKISRVDHEQHPAGRVGKPDDIARACLYLTDPANDFVSGINLVVDGGMTHKMIYA